MLLTVGHGALGADDFVERLRSVEVEAVIDIRRYPTSRRHPHFSSGAMATWLRAAGIGYRWDERLGGRREPSSSSRHVALSDAAFRGYADWMTTDDFGAALDAVLADAAASIVAVMCAESDWRRCHRRLVADAAELLHDVEVEHVVATGGVEPHQRSAGVRVDAGRLVYDVGVDRPLDAGP